MLKAVLDVNLYVSGAIKRNGHPAQIIHRSDEFTAVTSDAILRDLERVLHYDRIQKKFNLTEQGIAAYLSELRTVHQIIPGILHVNLVHADPDDDEIIACALEAGADYIITGDPHLLSLKQYRQIRIVTPRVFLEILDREKTHG